MKQHIHKFYLVIFLPIVFAGCTNGTGSSAAVADSAHASSADSGSASAQKKVQYLSQPLVTNIYTADPSAHVFDGRIYIYPSHDTATGIPDDDLGSQFDMRDYHILSMDSIGGKVTDNGVALDIRNIPWVGRQLWAPDAAFANNTYYLYFPAKDKKGVFHIGVATGSKPEGPFTAEKAPIPGSYSIDPCVFKDDDGRYYMYFGGIWGGQLQKWNNNTYDSAKGNRTADQPAILPRVARLSADMKRFAEPVREIQILGSDHKPFYEKDNDKRFFEGSWMFKYKGKYYFTYSTGDNHRLVYATGASPYGPFVWQGVILTPVEGWTTHHSIISFGGKWWLFYHDTQLSGKTNLRNVKVTGLTFRPDGTIETITAQR